MPAWGLLLLYNTGRNNPDPISAVEIRIETDKGQAKFFCNNILVCVIKIKVERCCYLLKALHIFTAKRDDGNTPFSEKIPEQIREQVCSIFLVQDNPK